MDKSPTQEQDPQVEIGKTTIQYEMYLVLQLALITEIQVRNKNK